MVAAAGALGLSGSAHGRAIIAAPREESVHEVAELILQGRVVPLIGAGANSCGRPHGLAWDSTSPDVLPDGQDLATTLAASFGYPTDEPSDLAHVSQYISLTKGSGPLYDELHQLLDADYPPGPVHRLLADIPGLLRGRGAHHQLIVTTNYDRALERALTDAGEEFDVVSYVATGRDKGRFVHTAPDGRDTVIEVPNSYGDLSLEERTVILKLHGQVDANPARDRESFVVTEDDYIDYVANVDVSSLVPVTLAAVLRRSHFLFLGYSLRDWYPRGVLYRTWGEGRLTYRSWAVDSRTRPVERELLAKPRCREHRRAARDLRGRASPPAHQRSIALSINDRTTEAAAATLPDSPYKGLASYEDTDLDAALFFGRERDSQILAANLVAFRLTVLYGPSGIGKSSIVRAGVARELRREDGLPVAVFSAWSGDPVQGIVDEVARVVGIAPPSGTLADALGTIALRTGRKLYLVLDQTEEYFVYHEAGAADGGFAEQFPELVGPS